MYSEARKLNLIENVLKIKSEAVLLAIEQVIKKNSSKVVEEKPSIYDFVGMLSHAEANDMRKAIAESCETINEDDWK